MFLLLFSKREKLHIITMTMICANFTYWNSNIGEIKNDECLTVRNLKIIAPQIVLESNIS
jgi:hypothetical protein